MNRPLVVAMTGASGAIYAARLLQVLALIGDRPVFVTFSPSAATVIWQELGVRLDARHPEFSQLWPDQIAERVVAAEEPAENEPRGSSLAGHMGAFPEAWRLPGGPPRLEIIRYAPSDDFMAPIASGSYLTSGMVIIPCSGNTLSSVVRSESSNLIHRAAEVHLKERRKLVLVPRETPLSQAQLENMTRASQLGAVVLPAMPGWYHGVSSVVDLVDFVVARVLDQFGINHQLMRRWGEEKK